MDSFGAYLRAHREKKGIRLEEIASITKIHLHSLELLESNKWDALPPEPFIRGFIIAYAKYVGIPTSEVLDRFREATGTAPPVVENAQNTTPEPSHAHLTPIPATPGAISSPNDLITQMRLPSGAKMITAASLFAVVGLAVVLINVGREAEDKSVASTPAPATPSPVEVATTNAVPATPAPNKEEDRKVAASAPHPTTKVDTAVTAPVALPAAALGTPVHEVVIEGKERTWIKVVIDENPPTEYFLPEGKAVTYKASGKIKVVLGNSTGSRVTYNGKEMDGKQFMGTIRTYKFPENARFPQDVPSKRTPTTASPESEATPKTETAE
jgi:cytoskeleton protein RodZ